MNNKQKFFLGLRTLFRSKFAWLFIVLYGILAYFGAWQNRFILHGFLLINSEHLLYSIINICFDIAVVMTLILTLLLIIKVIGFFAIKNLTLKDEHVQNELLNFMFEAISSVNSIISEFAMPPKIVTDIYDSSNCIGTNNNAHILKLHLLRKRNDITNDDCNYIKNALQSAVNSRIQSGYLCHKWAFTTARVPIIKVMTVTFSALFIHFDILLTNNDKSIAAAILADYPTPSTLTDSVDPLFKDGE